MEITQQINGDVLEMGFRPWTAGPTISNALADVVSAATIASTSTARSRS
jgi:hypothetical protein